MAKTKKQARSRREAGGKKTAARAAESSAEAERKPLEANPPRKNLPLLLLSAALLLGFFIYLAVIAWTARGS